MEQAQTKKPKVIKANHMLQVKAGMGPLDPKKIEACEQIIEKNNFDFAPLANQYIQNLSLAIENAKNPEVNMEDAVQDMTSPVMQLKANAPIFKYDLIGSLANIILSFLEAVKKIDRTVLEIVGAHQKTLDAIVKNEMKGDGGEYGRKLEQELKDACKRYFQAKTKK